jgi:membrane protein implicated in regulation of membrane protease activity
MAESTLWWLLAGGAVAVELITGTFYLLMVAIGLAAAALAAHAGMGLTAQLGVAAVVGSVAVIAWHFIRDQQPRPLAAGANRDVNLDIGETVQVQAWNADGTATVHYRGAQWTVVHRPNALPVPGAHKVAEVVGNRLLVEPA